MTQRRRPRMDKKWSSALCIALSVLLVLAFGTGCDAIPGFGRSNADKEDTFYEGVFVDDISLGGLTMGEAKKKVEQKQKALMDSIVLKITHAKGDLTITGSDVTVSFDTDAMLKQAMAIGRTGVRKDDRKTIADLKETPVKLTTSPTVDVSPAEQKVRAYTATLSTPGTDAVYTGFDPTLPEGQQMQITPDVAGTQVNPDKLWEQVKAAFASNDVTSLGEFAAQEEPLPAAVTVADVQNSLQLIGTFTTTIKNHAPARLNNINLVNSCISGQILQPGDTLSVNKLTGERTAAKGYKKAPVDTSGIEDVGLGGGACQVSGTLYNAAISAGPNIIKIVEREHHSLPSAYLKLGTDATVDYPSKDLQFTNVSEKPILIVMYYKQDEENKFSEHANIYGVPDPEGATYHLEGIVDHVLIGNPDAPARTVPINALAPGETKLIPARNGYVVNVYLVKTTKDGTVTKEMVYTDTYPASGPVLAYYVQDPRPTAMPTETPLDGIVIPDVIPVETPMP